jgi:hypothetical protein
MLMAIALLLIATQIGLAGTLVLKRAWIEKYKDRATIDASFTVDAAHKHPNHPEDDADMHVAGRAPKQVGLPMVAEMVNAFSASTPSEKKAIELIHANEGTGKFVPISGAWRLWFEHPAHSQTQFAPLLGVPGDTNPDHSFEIHPLSKFDGQDLTGTFHFIDGFTGYDATTAFGRYEKGSISIRSTASAVTLDSKKMVYNYTHFHMHLRGTPLKLKDDGYAALADVIEEGGDEDDAIATKVRMIFVPQTAPWKIIDQGVADGSVGDGSEFDALGIPRVNLNAISTFLKDAGTTAITRKLPYEIIIVGLK